MKSSSVLDHISSCEHFQPKRCVRRHRKAVRNLWWRFELDPSTVARVACPRSFFFSPTGVDKTISRVSLYEAYFVRKYQVLSVFVALSRAHNPGHIPRVDNKTCREHAVTTLPPISISRQHGACATRPSAPYYCGCSNCVNQSLQSVIHHLYLALLLLCVTDPRSLWTEM